MLEILAETSDWIAIKKPCGIVVEAMPQGFLSVEEMVWQYLAQKKREPFVGIVHRLDRPVSGVLLLAKKKSVLKILNEQFSTRKVQKIYWAWVENCPPQKEQLLTHWLQTDTLARKAKLVAPNTAKAVLCSLTYRQLNDMMPIGNGVVLEINLQTGKFHQIRTQLAAINCPIVGDEKYGALQPYQPNAIALHAASLSFFDPTNANKKVCLTANCSFYPVS